VNQNIADGSVFSTPEGVDIWHVGNVYTIFSPYGDSVRATVFNNHIDVSVGLGRWPAKVAGLLANANDNVNALAARDGTACYLPLRHEAGPNLVASKAREWVAHALADPRSRS